MHTGGGGSGSEALKKSQLANLRRNTNNTSDHNLIEVESMDSYRPNNRTSQAAISRKTSNKQRKTKKN